MLYQISNGTVSVGGGVILSHIDFEIHGNEKIAVVGRNGAGKTTLLKLVSGELSLDRDDRRRGPGIRCSRQLTVGMLSQQAFKDGNRTVEEELLEACPCRDTFERERFEYEREYDTLFTGFGFPKEDKKKPISRFSGGEQTKIALIRLLLQKPDILLLDEPTNHLDITSKEILEQALNEYTGTVLYVSHDRYFINQTATRILELVNQTFVNYIGNYDYYLEKKEELTAAYAAPITAENPVVLSTSQEAPSDSKLSWQEQKEQQAKERKRKNELKKTEDRIAVLEERNEEIDMLMTQEEVYSNSVKCQELALEKDANNNELEELYEKWEELAE